MPAIIPVTPSVAFQEIDLELDGYAFKFSARWNARDAAWFLSFHETTNVPITTSCKAVLGTLIGRACNHRLFRRGVFVVEDTAPVAGKRRDATFDDFGTRVELRYYTAQEIAATIAAKLDDLRGH